MKKIKFRVHSAVFTEDPKQTPHLFLNVRNDSKSPIIIRDVSFRSIGYDAKIKKQINKQRPLPVVLHPGKEWETWVLSTPAKKEQYNRFRMYYLNSKGDDCYVDCTKRRNVPPKGTVPNGN
jgi:hypothetical protein